MVDKSSFAKMLIHVLNVEFVEARDSQTDRFEEELNASAACNAFGMVDVKHFVDCLQGGEEGTENMLGTLSRSQQKDGRLAGTSFTASQATPVGIIINPDKTLSMSSLSTAVIGEQIPLPSPKDQA
eukprot:4072522-Amphidinium_carterae.1